MPTIARTAFTVGCPQCGAKANQKCQDRNGDPLRFVVHNTRTFLWFKVDEETSALSAHYSNDEHSWRSL